MRHGFSIQTVVTDPNPTYKIKNEAFFLWNIIYKLTFKFNDLFSNIDYFRLKYIEISFLLRIKRLLSGVGNPRKVNPGRKPQQNIKQNKNAEQIGFLLVF